MKQIRLSQIFGLAVKSLLGLAPQRVKRSTFVASFSALGKEITAFDNESLSKLNRAMNLSSDPSALKIPVHFADVIWDGKSLKEVCGEEVCGQMDREKIHRIATKVAEAAPQNLRYPREKQVEDIEKYLLERQAILG